MDALPDLDELLARKQALQSAPPDPQLSSRLRELRAWQAARLARTYADLGADARYAPALEFFLSDLYGPHEFIRRDRDLTRAAAPLRRALPQRLLDILCAALELDLLTLQLDTAMASHLGAAPSEASYAAAYRATGRPSDRERQIDLIHHIGTALDGVVRRRSLGFALRAAHIPAHVAGLGALQDFLERGWAAFRSLPPGGRLFDEIRRRERALMTALFQGHEP